MSGPDVIKRITNEARRIEEDSLYSAKGHLTAASWWGRTYLVGGAINAVLAAIAGVLALSTQTALAGWLALLVAALTAGITFLNPGAHANSHRMAGNHYLALRNQARMFREIDLDPEKPHLEARQQLSNLARRRDQLNVASPQIPAWAFRRARRGIQSGEADYELDAGQWAM